MCVGQYYINYTRIESPAGSGFTQTLSVTVTMIQLIIFVVGALVFWSCLTFLIRLVSKGFGWIMEKGKSVIRKRTKTESPQNGIKTLIVLMLMIDTILIQGKQKQTSVKGKFRQDDKLLSPPGMRHAEAIAAGKYDRVLTKFVRNAVQKIASPEASENYGSTRSSDSNEENAEIVFCDCLDKWDKKVQTSK